MYVDTRWHGSSEGGSPRLYVDPPFDFCQNEATSAFNFKSKMRPREDRVNLVCPASSRLVNGNSRRWNFEMRITNASTHSNMSQALLSQKHNWDILILTCRNIKTFYTTNVVPMFALYSIPGPIYSGVLEESVFTDAPPSSPYCLSPVWCCQGCRYQGEER